VAVYNPKNFEKQVTQNREKGISVVQFYKASGKPISLLRDFTKNNTYWFCLPSIAAESTRDKGQYEKFAIEQKKMLRIGAIDCDEFSKICEKEGVKSFPTYRVYPPFPVPH